MSSMTIELRNIEGTEAALGWAGAHTIVVDRPDGKAGGRGLGFNGGELLALALGGCFCNDLRYVASAAGISLGRIAVSVTLDMDGEPLLATGATMTIDCETLDGSDPHALIKRTEAISMAANSLRRGCPVAVQATG